MLRLLTQREAALALSLSTRSMERMRCTGGGPKYVRLLSGSDRLSRNRSRRVDRTSGSSEAQANP